MRRWRQSASACGGWWTTRYACWRDQLQPQLEEQRLRFHTYPDVPSSEREHFASFFTKSIYPVLTPLAIDPAHPFPQLLNKSLNVIVELEGGEDFGTDIAVVTGAADPAKSCPVRETRERR